MHTIRPADELKKLSHSRSTLPLEVNASGRADDGALAVELSRPALKRIFAYYRERCGTLEPQAECMALIGGKGVADISEALQTLSAPWSDYAIACVYALLTPRDRRKELGIYFTPPHLVDHLLKRMCAYGLDPTQDSIRDPAAGGAAFLVPLARVMVSRWSAQGLNSAQIVDRLRERLHGREIDEGLAAVANALLRRMLVREFACPRKLVHGLRLVRVGDSLAGRHTEKCKHEMGNPPYFRLGSEEHHRWKDKFSDIASGRLNLYSMFVRRALDCIPPSGLVGYVIPASFIGGPDFSAFRRRVVQLAEVVVLDAVEKRSDVFCDVLQDTCFIVLRRRPDNDSAADIIMMASSGILHGDGRFTDVGSIAISKDGTPWTLSKEAITQKTATLAEHGYCGRIGLVVANRETDRLYNRPGRDRYPLVWAKCVTTEGNFDFERGRKAERAGGYGYVYLPGQSKGIVRTSCILVQRTSASSQRRRLTAAVVPNKFIKKHGGIVGENHVILLVPTRRDATPPSTLAAILNSDEASAALTRVCRSASISVRLLEGLPLPLPKPAPTGAPKTRPKRRS